jgi:hypothetical protein
MGVYTPVLYFDDDQVIRMMDNTVLIGNEYDIVLLTGSSQPSSPVNPASVTNMSRRQRYWIPKAAMMEALDIQRLNTGIFDYTWDDISEQSFQQADWIKDHLSDEEVELIQYSKGVVEGHDHDADNQLLWLDYYKDHLSDEGVEKITLPPIVFQLNTWDADFDSQQWIGYQLDKDLSDTGVERIQLPQSIFSGWDLDIERQIPFPEYYKDHLSDEGVELIQLSPGIIRDWDTDLENMIPQPGWTVDYEDFDLYQFIPPTVTVVPIVYKVGAKPEIEFEQISTNLAVSLCEFDTELSIKYASFSVVPQVLVYAIQCSNAVLLQSIQNHGPV